MSKTIRRKIVAGNWKMNLNSIQALELVTGISTYLENQDLPEHQETIICPAAPHLYPAANAIAEELDNKLSVGAQNCYPETSGAYTGEMAPEMLLDIGCKYVLVGHSERRKYFGESHDFLSKKVDKALEAGLTPIFCCGESLDIREAGTQEDYVATQLRESLFHLTEAQFAQLILAYEPVWAIGTGKTASPEQAQDMHAAIRQLLVKQYGSELANGVTILYGGSCKPANAEALFSQKDVDGGLIGGASLKTDSFTQLIEILASFK